MGLTSALNTSLNGLTLNETSIDVLGNNIANAGTNGFKASRVLFETQLSRTLSVGSRPTSTNGGTNPLQIGLGANTASITKDFTQGSITNSTSPSDLAIQGDGFFIVDGPEGNSYSRNGGFSLNSQALLTNSAGLRVQGYGIDDDFNLITTQLTDISIPLGNLNVAQQTRNIDLGGALLSTGSVATQGSLLQSAVLFDSADAGPNNFVDGTTFLTNVQVSDGAGGFIGLFTDGETLSFAPRKGGRVLSAQTLDVAAGATTVADLLGLIQDTLGIASGGGIPNDPNAPGGPGQPGVTVDATTGQLNVVGNMGSVNDINLSVGDLVGDNGTVPLAFTKLESATGESTILDFVVFDSLGQQVNMQLGAVLESRDSTSTTFRYFVESSDDSDSDVAVSNGIIQFDSVGKVIGGGTAIFSVDRNDSAAVSPMQITANFSKLSGISTASAGSALSLQSQDGSNAGTLTSFVIDETGIINGVFDNGIIRTLGQIALARFSNPQGLLENGGGTFQVGVSSGSPFLVTPGSFGAGAISAGAIELSNTDIGRNLVDLIVASTNYRGNARVISSIQQLVDELLVLGR